MIKEIRAPASEDTNFDRWERYLEFVYAGPPYFRCTNASTISIKQET